MAISLFDARDGKKISEDLEWEVSSEEVASMIIRSEGPSVSVITNESDIPEGWITNPSQVLLSLQ